MMASNVDYQVCPECGVSNAAQWNPIGRRSYDVSCSECGYVHERGTYESVRNLTLQDFLRAHQQEQARDLDEQEVECGIWDSAHMEMLKRIYGEYDE